MARRRLLVRRIVTTPATPTSPTPAAAPLVVRRARREDLPRLVELIAAHAEYEHATVEVTDLAARLERTLIEPPTRAACFVAETSTPTVSVVGYATCTIDFSTWSASEYLHMDTLYVEDASRGHGIGRHLVDAITSHATQLGLGEVQWQTPVWNTDAVRFYQRLGATATNKIRFKLALDSSSPTERQ
jgi:ribosomal protein S18 acetylase RimI-like enzyme